MSLLPTLLDSLRGESLDVSLLFNQQYCHKTIPVTQPGVPDTPSLKETVSAFKDSLKVPADKLREIEQNTREGHPLDWTLEGSPVRLGRDFESNAG